MNNYWEEIRKQRTFPLTEVQQIFQENGFNYGEKGDLLLSPQGKKKT